jgi:hypothetical protein
LAVDHDWWWPDDAEKLSKAMKDMGWHSFWKREEMKMKVASRGALSLAIEGLRIRRLPPSQLVLF